MHQHPRHPPRVSSPASSPQTNPTRSNNSRDGSGPQMRASPDSPRRATASPGGSAELEPRGPSRESIKKLDQILQNLYLKAAVVIAQSRIRTTPLGPSKINKWFSLETDEIEEFRNEFRTWKTCSAFENPFPPMVIETYLDASRLSPSQCLVVVDDNGKRWDVLEALNSSETSDDSPTMRRRNTEVILERWRLELKPTSMGDIEDFGPILPTIYKKSIIFFRSLFVASRVIPAYKFSQQAMTKRPQPALEVKCRILTGETESSGYDALRQPLSDGRDVVTDYVLGDLEVPIGRFYASATYRNECHFRVDDAESLLSSRFMGVDEHFFKPSLPQSRDSSRRESSADVGSFPSRRHVRGSSDAQQTYGSLSTFHGAGAPGTSPISALRAIKPAGSDTGSPPGSVPASVEEPPHSLPIRRPSNLSLRDGHGRRPSVSFQPFKAGSLSGSPRLQDGEFPSSPLSGQRPSGLSALAQARKRNSLTAGMPASLRGGPPPAEPPTGSSPRPSSGRIGSSFSHRRGRPSFGGQSRGGDDDQTSSGRQSLSSSVAQPGSGLLAEAGGQASSGSLNADDDNISEFLKVLDSKKTLSSFESGKKGESATKRTVAQLSKFQHMRDSNNALTESMASSMQLQRSSSSSSRQLNSVPGMVAPNSMSVSSSPGGKPLSPHTPHTPAIPSRLSENSIIDYEAQAQAARRATRVAPQIESTEEESATEVPLSPEGTTAIDIPLPLSPRIMQGNRRSSSVAQQHRAMVEEDDPDLAYGGHRSISLGAEPTASTLFGMEHGESAEDAAALQPAANIRMSATAGSPGSMDPEKNPPAGLLASNSSSSPVRLRYRSTRGRPTPPQSSRGSFAGGSSGRYGMGRGDNDADEEPLVFDMQVSEMGRRSLEEGRGGGTAGSSSNDRYEPRGVSRRGW